MRTIARHLAAMIAVVLVDGLLSATLVRLAPGFDVDERQLDSRLSAESVHALRQAPGGLIPLHALALLRPSHPGQPIVV